MANHLDIWLQETLASEYLTMEVDDFVPYAIDACNRYAFVLIGNGTSVLSQEETVDLLLDFLKNVLQTDLEYQQSLNTID